MESKSFFFGLHCADFLVDTSHLSNEAVGCYIKLLCRMFLERDCTLQYRHAHKICGYASEGKKWTKIWTEELEPLFMSLPDEEEHEGKGKSFTNSRLMKEKNKINIIREQRSVAGKRGVIAKRNYRSQSTKANALPNGRAQGKANSNQTVSNIELDTEIETDKNNKKVIDRFSTVENTHHSNALNLLNTQG